MGEKRKAYRIQVGKPREKKPLGRPRHRWMDNIVTCFEVTRHRPVSADTRLVADSLSRCNDSIISFQGVTMSDSFAVLKKTLELASWSRIDSREQQKSKEEFNRTVRSSSRFKGQFTGRSSSGSEKAVRVGVQEPREPSCFGGPGRSVRPVGFRGMQGTADAKQKLLKKLILVN
jgi:hypothetical protein